MRPSSAGRGDGHPAVRRRPPSPGPFPRKLHGGRGEFDPAPAVCSSRHLSPTQFVGERPGEGGARRSRHTILDTLNHPAPPLPRSWGRGRPPSRGTSETPGGGEGPRRRSENPAAVPLHPFTRSPCHPFTLSPVHPVT